MSDHITRRTFTKLLGASAAALAVGDAALPALAGAAPHLPTAASAAASAAALPALVPEMQAVIDALAELEAPKITDLTPTNARQGSALTNAVLAVVTQQGKSPVEPVGNIAHRLIPGGAGQQLLLRIYQPTGPGPFPALVYFHGGGWVIANLDTYDPSCRALCNAAQCAVISVAYRQAPEHRFPAAPEDALAAYRWVLANAASIRVDPRQVAVGGESAGGNLATVTALLARDRKVALPVHQLLIYPITNYAFNTDSYREFVDAQPLNTPLMQWFWGYYLRRSADGASPYASPLRADVRGLPSATVITAEVDPLRDEGEAYAARLKAAGVATTLTRYTGVTHEFFSMAGIIPKAKDAVAEAAAGLKAAFSRA